MGRPAAVSSVRCRTFGEGDAEAHARPRAVTFNETPVLWKPAAEAASLHEAGGGGAALFPAEPWSFTSAISDDYVQAYIIVGGPEPEDEEPTEAASYMYKVGPRASLASVIADSVHEWFMPSTPTRDTAPSP